jgi:CBS domain-containing protein
MPLDSRLAIAYIEAIVAIPSWTTQGTGARAKGAAMQVRDGMTSVVLSIGPLHTLRAAAKLMSQRGVGAAVVMDPDGYGPSIITERDLLNAIGAGEDPDTELVADHLTSDVVLAAPGWSLEEAAMTMVNGGFRHLLVVEHGEMAGILSVRDVVRCWTSDGAICPVPAGEAVG